MVIGFVVRYLDTTDLHFTFFLFLKKVSFSSSLQMKTEDKSEVLPLKEELEQSAALLYKLNEDSHLLIQTW